jgi:hypothetical protein
MESFIRHVGMRMIHERLHGPEVDIALRFLGHHRRRKTNSRCASRMRPVASSRNVYESIPVVASDSADGEVSSSCPWLIRVVPALTGHFEAGQQLTRARPPGA